MLYALNALNVIGLTIVASIVLVPLGFLVGLIVDARRSR